MSDDPRQDQSDVPEAGSTAPRPASETPPIDPVPPAAATGGSGGGAVPPPPGPGGAAGAAPPPPPPHQGPAGGSAAPPPPPPPHGGPGTVSPNRNVMVVLSYLWILFLIPMLVETGDREVQWHAKHGAVLSILELIVYVALFVLTLIPAIGCLTTALYPLVWLGALVVRILAIVKGINGERFLIPGVSEYADRF